MRRKLLFFVNPNAGHAEIRSSLMEVLQVFTIGGYDVTVHPTRAPRDLTETIKEMGADYDLIVCTGGDGTLNEAVNGMMALEKRPPLGYIPSGTVNAVASTLRRSGCLRACRLRPRRRISACWGGLRISSTA